MFTQQVERTQVVELEHIIHDRIAQRTGSRIQSLKVGVIEGKIVIGGRAPCHYLKQLALQGVIDALGSREATRIELHVDVASARALAPSPYCEV